MKTQSRIVRRQIMTADAGIRLREVAEGEAPGRTITGYAILFDSPSAPFVDDGTEEVREVIDRGAVSRELLDESDIKFTMYHDHQILLGRSRQGKGTLSYDVDERGVSFELTLPESPNGDEALEMVRRGDITGCSFYFSTWYGDPDCVERTVEKEGGRTVFTYRVKRMLGIYDFTLTPDPAYPEISVSARELLTGGQDLLTGRQEDELLTGAQEEREVRKQVTEMRRAARRKIYF